ncbi:protein-L-isoaspartate O-methyltransferase family protein [Oceaniglobus roseus]|uniref:protein-L-isoaspartate O-methyltransferase family protein n=1 Tax=Oceaniglobus roseus TaxID=1737570 RepID=UPI000C7F7334|nr:protein-L-isoaspartate O-methyltransferase [Kandeliimicrobium roseum]
MSDFARRRTMMVDNQIRPSDVTKFPIIDAMLSVPREQFVPAGRREAAYVGENMELGGGRVILDPRTLAKMLDAVDVQPDELVLDVGCSYGYSTAVLARLAEAVVAVEEDEGMAREAAATLSQTEADNTAVVEGPLSEGAAKHGPYDVILVQGGVQQLPQALLDQLAQHGRICCLFMDGVLGVVRLGYRSESGVSWRDLFNASAPVLPGLARRSAFAL